jgi:hypothetical protein
MILKDSIKIDGSHKLAFGIFKMSVFNWTFDKVSDDTIISIYPNADDTDLVINSVELDAVPKYNKITAAGYSARWNADLTTVPAPAPLKKKSIFGGTTYYATDAEEEDWMQARGIQGYHGVHGYLGGV